MSRCKAPEILRNESYLESPEKVKYIDIVVSYVYITGQLVPEK